VKDPREFTEERCGYCRFWHEPPVRCETCGALSHYGVALRRIEELERQPDQDSLCISVDYLCLLLISSVRYALRRRTYIVSETCRAVEENISHLRYGMLGIILRDIDQEFELCERMGETLGDACDVARWEALRARLREEIEKRKG
jgi:hypothetical protein